MRRIIEAILYLLRGTLLRPILPPVPTVSTVRRWFYLWRNKRQWLSVNYALVLIDGEAAGREASPSAGEIDSQSVTITESGGPQGIDACEKIKWRTRQSLSITRKTPLPK